MGKSKPLPEALRLPSDLDAPPAIVPAAAAFLPVVDSEVDAAGGSAKRTGILFFGDDAGRVHLTDEDATPLVRFQAFLLVRRDGLIDDDGE